MNLLENTIALSEKAGVNADDIQSIGLSWRWYLKVRSGRIGNPGVNHVVALKALSEKKLAKCGAARRGNAA